MPEDAFDFEDLIVGLYDSALGARAWNEGVAPLCAAVGAEMMQLHVARRSGDIDMLTTNFPAAILEGYVAGWWRKDPWVTNGMLGPRNVARRGSDLCTDSMFVRSEIYNELVRPAGDIRHMVGAIMDVDADVGSIGLLRPSAISNFDESHVRILQRVLPHLQRALQMSNRLALAERRSAAAQAGLDALAVALVVVDRGCRPLLANRAAEAILQRGDGLVGGIGLRPLATRATAETARLHALVAAASQEGSGRGPGGALQISRNSSLPAYVALVTPLVGAHSALFVAPGPSALLIIQDPADRPVPRTRILRDLYGLTPAECDLAERLASGDRLEDVAEQRGVRLTTLRSQLAALLAKTGTNRQAALVRLLAGLAV